MVENSQNRRQFQNLTDIKEFFRVQPGKETKIVTSNRNSNSKERGLMLILSYQRITFIIYSSRMTHSPVRLFTTSK